MLLAALRDLVLPSVCAGCRDAGGGRTGLCDGCTDLLTLQPLRRDLPGLTVGVAGPYRDPVRGALVEHKERGRLPLVRPLGAALAAAVLALEPPDRPLLLVPAPSAPAAVRARGQDHGRRLARAAADTLTRVGVPARSLPLLRQTRRVRDQAGLGVAARAENLDGALRCTTRPPPGLLVVVDDVLTTGATVQECARALRAAGGRVLGGAAVAGA